MLTCAQRGGVDAAPDVVEPVADPAPPAAVPIEAADEQAAIGAAVDSAPEEHVLAFPFLGNEVRIGEQVVENVGVQDWLARKFLAELVAFQHIAAPLTFREEELHLRNVPFEMTAFMVFLDPPAFGHEGIGVTVYNVFHRRDGGVATEDITNVSEDIAFAESLDFLIGPIPAAKRRF